MLPLGRRETSIGRGGLAGGAKAENLMLAFPSVDLEEEALPFLLQQEGRPGRGIDQRLATSWCILC